MAALMLSFNACEEISPVSLNEDLQTDNGLKILKFGDGSHSLAKIISQKKLITKDNGGVLNLLHGTHSSGNAGLLYGVDEDSPYNLYAIDPFDIGNPELVGQLAFRTRAIAVAPEAQLEWQQPIEQGTPVIKVLLVVADAGNTSTQDMARKSLFESWGFTVNLISDGASQSDFDNASASSSVAYISEEVVSGTLNTKLKQATIGVVNEERYLVDDFGIASSPGMSSDRDLQILDVTHYITSVFNPGYIQLFSYEQSTPKINNNPDNQAPELQILGDFGSAEPSFVVLEAGAALYGGGKAAGRRVELPFGHNDFDFNSLTDDGRILVRRALEWAAEGNAIAASPSTPAAEGLVYYASYDMIDGLYRIATFDPATGSNTILPGGSLFKGCDKLAFGPDGRLYGVSDNEEDELYIINTTTGNWTLSKTMNINFGTHGDMAFGADGKFYHINGMNGNLQVADLANSALTTINDTQLGNITGLASGINGVLYMSTENGKLYSVNPSNAVVTYLGETGIADLEDLASAYFEKELSYASVTLEVPANAINEDVEFELSLETGELLGGVAVTFAPHGIVFNNPVILNMTAYGVDFSNVDPYAVDIYYDNQESGMWELMQSDNVIVDVNNGTVQVINAQLPHFSRYAIATE